MQSTLSLKQPLLRRLRPRRWAVPALALLASLPASAQSGSDPWDNAVNVLKTSFTGTIATGLSLVAIVVGGLMFAYGEGQSKKTLAGIVFGVGMAIGAVNFLSLSRQPKCIPIVATQSISSLVDALPNEGVKTLLQAIRTKVFLTTSDPQTARYASELCGKADRTRISYTVSESSTNANVGWLSGRTSSSKGSVSASKQYQKHKEPLFEEKVFFDLKNAQSVVVAFDGVSPLPPTYCYLKPDFLPVQMTWFEQEQIDFDPERISE
jgi:type IV secretory pathway VirB2 component (pilin)